MQKILILLHILAVATLATNGQVTYSQKKSYRYSNEEGWVRVTEKEWITVSQAGDTTYWAQTTEETQQPDPGIKKDTALVLIPTSVFKIGQPVLLPDTVSYVRESFPVVKPQPEKKELPILLTSTQSRDRYKKGKNIYRKSKGRDYYHTKWRTRASRPQKAHRPKRVDVGEIKAITYKKKLWCVFSRGMVVTVVEAGTKRAALKKVGVAAISATEFSNFSILR